MKKRSESCQFSEYFCQVLILPFLHLLFRHMLPMKVRPCLRRTRDRKPSSVCLVMMRRWNKGRKIRCR